MAWFIGPPFAAPEHSRWHDRDRCLLPLVPEPGEAVEQLAELGELDGLGEVGERAAGQQAADDAAGGVGGKDDHGDGGGDRISLELVEYLVSLQVGQVQVEQDDVGHVPDGAFDAGPARYRGHQPGTRPASQVPGYHLDVRRVVLNAENAEAGFGRSDRE